MIAQRGIGVDDLAWIQRDQFVHYLTVARATTDPDHWPTFRQAVVEALTAAFGLDNCADAHDLRQSTAIEVLDAIRSTCDPATSWPEFMASLWERRQTIRPDLC